jgi:hypothetical protein
VVCGPDADGLELGGREQRENSLGPTDRHCDRRVLDHAQPGNRARPRVPTTAIRARSARVGGPAAGPPVSDTERADARREWANFEHVLFYLTRKEALLTGSAFPLRVLARQCSDERHCSVSRFSCILVRNVLRRSRGRWLAAIGFPSSTGVRFNRWAWRGFRKPE